jgi:hypothetical protein
MIKTGVANSMLVTRPGNLKHHHRFTSIQKMQVEIKTPKNYETGACQFAKEFNC